MVSRERIAQLVDRLDHPDSIHQREFMDKLVAMGPSIIEPLSANLEIVPDRVKSALVRVLGELGDPKALLPLMRFVWDSRGDLSAGDARGLAMKALAELARPEDAGRLTAFLMDIAGDRDPFVRGWAAHALGRFGDRRATPILRDLVNDDDPFVQERAQQALSELDAADSDALSDAASGIDDHELLSKIRSLKGGEQEFWLDELLRRDNVLNLCADLVHGTGRGVIFGLRALSQLGHPDARGIARPIMSRADAHPDVVAIATRLVARFTRSDMTEAEAAAIRTLRYHDDRFVRLAALEAAAASGRRELQRNALERLLASEDADVALSVARGLSRSVGASDRSWFPEVSTAWSRVNSRRESSRDKRWVEAEAYTLRTLKNLVDGATLGRRKARKIAFEALKKSSEVRPIVVTSLELLAATVSAESDVEWSREDALNLVEILEEYRDVSTLRRTLNLLVRGAPAELYSAVDVLEDLAWRNDIAVEETVIPLLGRIASTRAREILEDLSESPDEAVRLSAETALRQERNARDIIDAEFEDSED